VTVVLKNYHKAGEAAWEMMKEFLVKNEMARVRVIVIDDLIAPSSSLNSDDQVESSYGIPVRLIPGQDEEEALRSVMFEVRRTYPSSFVSISSGDLWIPFLPYPPQVIASLVAKVCDSLDTVLHSSVKGYMGESG
jgi:hypothetical protein